MTHKKTVLSVFTILLCLFIQVSFAQSFPKSVTTEMAKRETRYHHFLWHNVRDNWNLLSPDGQSALRQLGWAPPRPSRTYDSQGNAIALTDNNSGEDFLYMHRQMIAKVNSIIAQNNDPYGKVVGWKTLPAPGDKSWPVPSSYRVPGDPDTTQSIAFVKTSSFYYNNIRPMEKKFTDAAQLRKMTLGQLGSQIEMTVHNWLHIRFSGRSASGYRFDEDFIPDVDKAWDNPQYNWLADTYSSHVNPIFWKLHGWVDDRIEDWRRANGLSSIRWKGTWTGGPMSSFSDVINRKEAAGSLRVPNQGGNQGDDNSDDVLVQVARIIAKEGVQSKFTDLVLLPDDPILVVGSVPVPTKAAPVQVKKSKRKTCRRR